MGKLIKYKTLLNGNEIEVNSDEYDNLHKSAQEIFNSVSEKIVSEFEMLEESSTIKNSSTLGLNVSLEKQIIMNFCYLKNSGIKGEEKKRFQLKKSHLKSGTQIYFIGIMNLGDSILYVLPPMLNNYLTNYVEKGKQKSTKPANASYSSYWINFEDIKDCYYSKKSKFDKKNNFLTLNVEEMINVLIKRIFKDSAYYDNSFEHIAKNIFDFSETEDDYVPEFELSKVIYLQNANKLIRDKNLIANFRKQNQECKLCGLKETFPLANQDGLNYFEIHHYIPYNFDVQKKFRKTLDAKINLISLCANCHRSVHLSEFEFRKELIDKMENIMVDDKFLKTYPEYNDVSLIEIYKNLFSGGNEDDE